MNKCTCRPVTCEKCQKKAKPRHIMNDSRRYCPYCGYNLGIKTCTYNEPENSIFKRQK